MNNQNTGLDNLDANLNGTPDTSPKVNGYPNCHPTLAGTPYTSPQVNGYPKRDFAPIYTPDTLPKVNGYEDRDLTSTGTPDTLPMVNRYSPVQTLQRKRNSDKDTYPISQSQWGQQAKLNNEILQQLKLTQGFLHAQGKKGFRFKDNPDHYESLVTIYKEKTGHEHLNDTERFNIFGTLLEGEAETLYNRHLSESNKTNALTRVGAV